MGLSKDLRGGEELKVISFSLGENQYGIKASQILEVVRIIEVTKIPRTFPYLEDTFNYRGKIIPLLILREHLGLKRRNYTAKTPIFIVKNGSQLVGVLVDAIRQVLTIKQSLVENISPVHPLANVLAGIANFKERPLLLLDFNKILQVLGKR